MSLPEDTRKQLVALATLSTLTRKALIAAMIYTGVGKPPYCSELTKAEIVSHIARYRDPVAVLQAVCDIAADKDAAVKAAFGDIPKPIVPDIPNFNDLKD